MRSTFKVSGGLLFAVSIVIMLSLQSIKEQATIKVKLHLLHQVDSFANAVRLLQGTLLNTNNSPLLQQRFRLVRLAYKRIEWATEYFDPLTARQVNGPPVPEAELNGLVIQPDGLQMIEADLFPHFQPSKRKDLHGLLSRLAVNAMAFREQLQKTNLPDWQVLDAAKQEVFRVETLGLNDFDDPLLKNCFNESAVALLSVGELINGYRSELSFRDAVDYLRQPRAFDLFDRAAFIRNYANPLTKSITNLQNQMNLTDVKYNRLLNQDAATLFDANAFNRNAFIRAPEDSATGLKIALGRKLFSDPILSGTMARSCASCHQSEKAFTDGLVKNVDITGKKMISRNTPTLINAALQPALFYDLRAASLEDQANDVVQNADEMHGDMKIAINRLWKDETYRKLFEEAFQQPKRMGIDTFEVMNALASYVRSLTSLNSPFDRFMRGDNAAITNEELTGFNLFMGKAKCSTCHYLPLFNGALPPRYMQMEAEVIGVPQKKNGNIIDSDPGTHDVQPFDFNRHAFKVTTVRNAALSAPYMHNGIFKTLEEVIDFYDKGGGAGMGIKVTNQTLPRGQLHLTVLEKQQLIAFIKSLSN